MSLKPKMMGSHMSAGGPVATWQPPPPPPGIAGDVRQDNCYCMHGMEASIELLLDSRLSRQSSKLPLSPLSVWGMAARALTKMKFEKKQSGGGGRRSRGVLAKNSGTECRCLVPGELRWLHMLAVFLPERSAVL